MTLMGSSLSFGYGNDYNRNCCDFVNEGFSHHNGHMNRNSTSNFSHHRNHMNRNSTSNFSHHHGYDSLQSQIDLKYELKMSSIQMKINDIAYQIANADILDLEISTLLDSLKQLQNQYNQLKTAKQLELSQLNTND